MQMHSTTIDDGGPSEVAILARVLGNEDGSLTPAMARYILKREFTAPDKARMHELVQRNQDGDLSPDEKDELLAYVKAGTMLSILKARARRVLRVHGKKRPAV